MGCQGLRTGTRLLTSSRRDRLDLMNNEPRAILNDGKTSNYEKWRDQVDWYVDSRIYDSITQFGVLHHTKTNKRRICKLLSELAWSVTCSLWQEGRDDVDDDKISRLHGCVDLILEIYEALTPENATDESEQKRYCVWSHLDFCSFFWSTTLSSRMGLLYRDRLKRAATKYLEKPWMHHYYIDWILTDSLMASSLIETYDWVQKQRLGFGYLLFDGSIIKARIFKTLVIRPFGLFLNWGLPALICWMQYNAHPIVTLIGGSLWFAYAAIWTIYNCGRRLLSTRRGAKSPRRVQNEALTKMLVAYEQMRESSIHVPSLKRALEDARQVGVVWDAQILCVVDNVVAKDPITWVRVLTRFSEW